jgi:hypothetical protein
VRSIVKAMTDNEYPQVLTERHVDKAEKDGEGRRQKMPRRSRLVVGAQGIRSAQDYRRTENAHAYEVVAILKSQPRWTELAAALRKLPHLKLEPTC